MNSQTEQENIYATLPMRIKAMAIDSLIYALLFISLPMLMTSLFPLSNEFRIISMILPILFLEPFLVSLAGCTIGQYLMGIRVITKESGEKCFLPLSFLRYFIKFLLGFYSLIYMLFSSERQAIHDFAAKTIVVLSKRKQEAHYEVVEEQEEEARIEKQYEYPSGFRRFVFFIIWYVIALVVMGGISIFLLNLGIIIGQIPPEEIENSNYAAVIGIIFSIIDIILFFAIAYWAAKGYLPGAKRKLVSQDAIEAEEKPAEIENEQTEIENEQTEIENEQTEIENELTEKQTQFEIDNRAIVKGYTSLFTLFGLILGMVLSIILLDDIIEIFLIILLVSFAGSVFGYFIGVFKKKSVTENLTDSEIKDTNQNDQKDIE